MADFQRMYTFLFAQITDAIEALERDDPAEAKRILIFASYQAEDMYIESSADDQ